MVERIHLLKIKKIALINSLSFILLMLFFTSLSAQQNVLNKDFLSSVQRNTADANSNGLRDDIDYILANQGNFTESEKELAELFAM